jgi:hypothetical protein
VSNNTEKRMVGGTGYEVKQAMQIGGREIIIAENMDEPDGKCYMKAEYSQNGIIGQYDRVINCSDYLSIVEEFIGAIDRQIVNLRGEIGKADYQAKVITAGECYPNDYARDITGEVVAIKASALRAEYRRGDCQMVYVTHGNGAKANPRGNGVYCYHLSDGAQTRFERYDIQGIVKELPPWAEGRLSTIRSARQAAGIPEKVEIVAGYTITARIQAGKTLFVLGENPNAVSPYVTWQRYEGKSGYDHGHYFVNREKAATDLQTRADMARDDTGNNMKKPGNRSAR